MERGLGPITTRKVKTLRGSGLRIIQPRITFPHLNPTLHGPSMTNVIGNLPYLDQTAKILMIGMKKPNHGKLKNFLQSASHFVRTRVPRPQDLFRPTAFPSLKKPPSIVDTMPIATPQGTLDFKSVDKVTFVGASSNTVIDTTTGSLGVGVDGNGPSSNLHVVGHTRLEGDINMLHTANTASIKLTSNVVTEFPRSKNLIKYPRVAMTGATTGGYTATASGEESATRQVENLFNNLKSESGGGWRSNTGYNSSGVYTGSSNLGSDSGGTAFANADKGEWVKIQLPHKIQLNSFTLTPRLSTSVPSGSALSYGRAEFIKNGKIWGSLNGTSWSVVHTISGSSASSDTVTNSYTVSSSTAYNYFALVVTNTNSGVAGIVGTSLSEWELYGTPEYDPEADGVDVVVKSVPNVPNTDWLEVYYDAKDLVDGAVSTAAGAITGLGGTTNNGTAYGGVTVSDGAFVFDGSGDYIESGLTINAVGTPQHTFSLWVKPSTGDMDDTNNHYLCVWGNTTAQNSWSGLALMGGKLLHAYHASGKYTSDVLFTTGNWHHIVVVIKSTIETVAIDRDADFYVDGVLYSGSYSTLGSQAGNSAYYLNWGSGTSTRVRLASLLSGGESSSSSIANFRLFNRALTSDEIWQLYAYQKEYFGHGDLSMTLKAGRLGIGTSEPRAALDVRGNLRASGLTIQTVSSTKTDTFSTTGASSHPVSPGNDVPGLAVTIHPKFANSKILVSYTVSTGAYGRAYLRIQRKQGGSTTTIAPSVGPEANTQNQGKCTTSHSGSGDSSVDSQSF